AEPRHLLNPGDPDRPNPAGPPQPGSVGAAPAPPLVRPLTVLDRAVTVLHRARTVRKGPTRPRSSAVRREEKRHSDTFSGCSGGPGRSDPAGYAIDPANKRGAGLAYQATGGRTGAPSNRQACRRARFGQGRVLAVLASVATLYHPARAGRYAPRPAA